MNIIEKWLKSIVFKAKSWYINNELQQGVGHAHSIIMFKRSEAVENIKHIETVIEPILQQMNLRLYEIGWHKENQMTILRIALMKDDGTIDIDTCAVVSEQISEVLDKEDLIAHEYFLEVCSPGAERELKSEQDIISAIHSYVYVKYKNPKAGRDEITGTLIHVDEEALEISYMDKAVKRQTKIERDNVALIRLAVKI